MWAPGCQVCRSVTCIGRPPSAGLVCAVGTSGSGRPDSPPAPGSGGRLQIRQRCSMPVAIEAAAASCTLFANAILLCRLCSNASSPMPVAVLMLQVVGNALWISHSEMEGDLSLLATAAAGLVIQTASLVVRWRAVRMAGRHSLSSSTREASHAVAGARRPILTDMSLEELPQLHDDGLAPTPNAHEATSTVTTTPRLMRHAMVERAASLFVLVQSSVTLV